MNSNSNVKYQGENLDLDEAKNRMNKYAKQTSSSFAQALKQTPPRSMSGRISGPAKA